MLRKIQALVADVAQPFEYGNVFTREVVHGVQRLRIALDDGHQGFIQTVASCLTGPFQLLYVLHTSRTDAQLGRYESPQLSAEGVHVFLDRYGGFLSEDGRHDLWVRSHADDATIVWDRHNLIYAYGPLNDFESALLHRGAQPGAPPSIPDPHVHHYHPERDDEERAVLRAFDWNVKPLRESDVQFVAKSSWSASLRFSAQSQGRRVPDINRTPEDAHALLAMEKHKADDAVYEDPSLWAVPLPLSGFLALAIPGCSRFPSSPACSSRMSPPGRNCTTSASRRGEQMYEADDFVVSLLTPEQVGDVASALAAIDKAWLHIRYRRIEPADYGAPLSDDDFEYLWSCFVGLPDFFTKAAAAGRAMVFTVDL